MRQVPLIVQLSGQGGAFNRSAHIPRLPGSCHHHTPAGLIITSALMIWKFLVLVTGSESPVRPRKPTGSVHRWRHVVGATANGPCKPCSASPPSQDMPFPLQCLSALQIVVVLSGSMEPGFYRGDILFLDQPQGPIDTGDIIVFNAGDREIPIVHRIIKVHERHNNISAVDILTKVGAGAPCSRDGLSQLWESGWREEFCGSRSSVPSPSPLHRTVQASRRFPNPQIFPSLLPLAPRATTTGATTGRCTPGACGGWVGSTSWGAWSGTYRT